MEGYVERKPSDNGQSAENGRETVRFFAPHEVECMTVTNVNGARNGPAALFEHGIKKLEWSFKDNKRVGMFTVFRRGIRLFSGWWDEDGLWDSRFLVEYAPDYITLNQYHSTTGKLVYTGGMGSNPHIREGWGLTFDAVTGQPQQYGLFASNVLLRCYQRFADDDMYEIAYDDDSQIVGFPVKEAIERVQSGGSVSHTTVYVGGFARKGAFMVRHGSGCEVSGRELLEGEWAMGERVKSWAVRNGVREGKKAFVCSGVFEEGVESDFKRSVGDDSFKRSVGDDSFKRSVGDDSFKRSVGDDSFKRSVGDDSFKRSVGDDSFKRSVGDDSFKRSVGDDSFKRSVGDDSFKRSVGDDSFKRSVGDDSFRRGFTSDNGFRRGSSQSGFPRRSGTNEWKPKPRYGDDRSRPFGSLSHSHSQLGTRPPRAEEPAEYQAVSGQDAMLMYKKLMGARGIEVEEDALPPQEAPPTPAPLPQQPSIPAGNDGTPAECAVSPVMMEKIEEIRNTKEFEEEEEESEDAGMTAREQQTFASLLNGTLGAGVENPLAASIPGAGETPMNNETPLPSANPLSESEYAVDVEDVKPPTLTRVVEEDSATMTTQQQEQFDSLFGNALATPLPQASSFQQPQPSFQPQQQAQPQPFQQTQPFQPFQPQQSSQQPQQQPQPFQQPQPQPQSFQPQQPQPFQPQPQQQPQAPQRGSWQSTSPFIPSRSSAPTWAPRTMAQVASQWLPEKAMPTASLTENTERKWREMPESSAIKTTKPRTVTTIDVTPTNETPSESECVLRTNQDYEEVSNRVTSIVIGEGCLNEGLVWRFDLSDCKQVKTLRIGSNSLKNVDEVRLCEMKMLEEIVIGDGVLEITEAERDSRRFTLCGLDRLKEVVVGDHSAEEYYDLEVRGGRGDVL